MSRGKHLSLEEARKSKKLARFAKEHPSDGDQNRFDLLAKLMAEGKLEAEQETSGEHSDED
ncbi:hypothetical protein MNBD_ALPHA12-2120 [hydrothermal vent metagenome]|uniref:Uncharacterized protein n=1 Tax=hydrothermal vent metagenome TaxID=652676 RepID=A0A3B0TMK2_9ZZZZ